ncbi:DUF3592 domain-containing protein [Allonocardiopsis opalescens]|uniref:Uncharacterized protein DUF3592 n=1 Tax=Allonocardiopsis opalescens TaxID=1144618 RepID=A0A2T0QFD1_9ACTN|nr:DUF3592 domain-containing protein [Allonocardiopsis opalescens]PRY02628.1 uncharacterized protein DUF3592 [Allonocardiopsis opalescens]
MDDTYAVLIAPIVGVIVTIVGVALVRSGRQLKRDGHRVPGVIVGSRPVGIGYVRVSKNVYLKVRGSSSGANTHAPVVRFRTLDGRQMTASPGYGSNVAINREGKEVTVIYDPDKPERVRIDGHIDNVLGPVLFIGLGLLFTVIGTLVSFAVLT